MCHLLYMIPQFYSGRHKLLFYNGASGRTARLKVAVQRAQPGAMEAEHVTDDQTQYKIVSQD